MNRLIVASVAAGALIAAVDAGCCPTQTGIVWNLICYKDLLNLVFHVITEFDLYHCINRNLLFWVL